MRVADLTRQAFINGDLSTVMSPRTVMTWAENAEIFGDIGFAFRLTFLNKCDELERPMVAEFYQRSFGQELPEERGKRCTQLRSPLHPRSDRSTGPKPWTAFQRPTKNRSASELKAAGYTPVRTALVLCLRRQELWAPLSARSILAIVLNAPARSDMETMQQKLAGAAAGAFAGRRDRSGQDPARQYRRARKIHDVEWRKLLLTCISAPGLEVRGNKPGGS